MAGRSPDEIKEEVRSASDIVQIIGEKVPLRRAGRTWKGLCPFHAEKTPSFTVNPERQIWHCFGCNRGGDVFSFLMERDKMTFPEALSLLAERAGVETVAWDRKPDDARRERLYQATALARDFFRASFGSAAGSAARAYLAGRRFDSATLDRFQVGWAPEGWDALATALAKLLPESVLEEAGLTARRGDGTHYDRFRNRIIFPIEVAAGRVAGFGARALESDQTPKYLNSPETAIYRKGGVLFGFPLARPAIRERRSVLVAEGYLDVMRLHVAGFPHAVSTCGTALTPEQARALARFDAEVVLVYDGDDAGVRAADRALDPLLEAGVSVKVLVLPDGEDPDSFLVKEGGPAFARLLEHAGDPAAFLAGAKLAGDGGANPTAEARVRRFVDLLRRVGDPIRRRMMIRRGSIVFGLEEEVLLEALKGRQRGASERSRRAPAVTTGAPLGASGATIPGGGQPAGASGPTGALDGPLSDADEQPGPLDPIEQELAARCLTEEGAVQEVASSGGASCFRNRKLQALLRDWIIMARAPLPEEARALVAIDPLARAILADHPVEEGRTDEMSRRGARDLLNRLQERRLKASIHELDQAIRQAERSQDSGSVDRLVAERRDLASKLHTRTTPAAP